MLPTALHADRLTTVSTKSVTTVTPSASTRLVRASARSRQCGGQGSRVVPLGPLFMQFRRKTKESRQASCPEEPRRQHLRVLRRPDGRQRSLTLENLPAAEHFKTPPKDHRP